MAKKVRWTTIAINDRVAIYKYWLLRNQSDHFPEKLEQLFEKSAFLISIFPKIGAQTNYRNVYSKVVREYKIFYRITEDEIQILRVWDSRRNPDSLAL
ncbi:toxin YoeB [Algoriphagus faecimaris]|uniref:Toxin YoeB n=1 Tax=Algoriphagus faecimaris TaxID=686796 RepID=A0A1G6REZ8_9BACT|nr:toxin YoeB [Algoriphagus faecimaris]